MARAPAVAGLAIAAALAAVLLSASTEPAPDQSAPPDDGGGDPSPDGDGGGGSFAAPVDTLDAFLYAIRCAENTPTPDGLRYGMFYGNTPFSNLSDHPVLTGEKRGVPLSDSMCRAAGFGVGCVSTAAGAYQINLPTWAQFRAAGKWGPMLPDFSPASQDECARRILVYIGAMPLIESGNIAAAFQRAGARWASLPGSSARQGAKSIGQVLAFYDDGLNSLG